MPRDTDEIVRRIAATAADSLGLASVSIGVRAGADHSVTPDVTCSHGLADLENEIPATPRSVCRIGSLTKQFTAAAIMRLVERGALRLDDELQRWIPEYPDTARGITIRHLLSHTSGITNYTELPEFAEKSRLDLTHRQLGTLFASKPLDFPPGTRFRYSNSGYFLLGVIIELATDRRYDEFMQQEIFEPLGLHDTRYLDDYRIVPRRAHGYDRWKDTIVNAGALSMSSPFAAGALGSTLIDLLAWESALTTGGVVTPASFDEMATPATLNDGSRTTYGYGMMIGHMRGRRKLSHAGTINGFRSQLAFYPDDDLIVAVLCNTGGAPVEFIESQTARAVLGVPDLAVHEQHLSQAELQRYAGKWASDTGPLTVALDGDSLTVGGGRMTAVGPGAFVMTGDPDTNVSFTTGTGAEDHLVIEREGQYTRAQRAPAMLG